jgi:hypothetical protein
LNVTEDVLYAEVGRLYIANRLLERALAEALEAKEAKEEE